MAAEKKNNKRASPALPGMFCQANYVRGRCVPGASVDMAVSDYFAGNDLLSKKRLASERNPGGNLFVLLIVLLRGLPLVHRIATLISRIFYMRKLTFVWTCPHCRCAACFACRLEFQRKVKQIIRRMHCVI